MCNDAQDNDLPGRVDSCNGHALPATAAAAASPAAANDDLPRRIAGCCRNGLPHAAASAAATAAATAVDDALGRARLIANAAGVKAPAAIFTTPKPLPAATSRQWLELP
ncbi:MAG: hypothetical protein JOZ79_01075 [Sphingomonas sp.]|nr:hypothetical protein [Sphingomonas sp.]